MIRLYAVNILPLQDEARFAYCYARSSQDRQEKADVLQMPADKARCIAAGLLLEYAYKKYRTEKIKELANANSFGYAQNVKEYPQEVPGIAEGMRGKPEFIWPEDTENRIFFNLSHSGNYVICVMADFEVGADIQVKTRVRESLLRRFFSEEEQTCMEMCGEDETLRERTFARIWASKEAAAKLTGRGIGQMLSVLVRKMEGKETADAQEYHLWQGVIDEDYAWAVACEPEMAGKETDVLEPVMADEGELFYEGTV
nr:4'-phosphopantetheinyl transferase superfamily protein [Lachnospiraceae bacterium]